MTIQLIGFLERITDCSQTDYCARRQRVIDEAGDMGVAGIDLDGGNATLTGLHHRAGDIGKDTGGADAEHQIKALIQFGIEVLDRSGGQGFAKQHDPWPHQRLTTRTSRGDFQTTVIRHSSGVIAAGAE